MIQTPWEVQSEAVHSGTTQLVRILESRRPLTFQAAIQQWRGNPDFCDFFNRVLADAPFAACFWELPPVTRATIDQPFEFVLIDSPALANCRADPGAFREHFEPGCEIASFRNLGGDALLIAPCPTGPIIAYPHLSAFARHAPEFQRLALWKVLGETMADQLTDQPLWISTSGLGIYWLHLRLDSRPKYYNHAPYKNAVP